MVAAQHSGSGKANQYFLRGFNLDHGTDFTTYIDGVQMNLRSHGHGQGYLDLNGLIPEIVAREDFRKALSRGGGDFALAGAAYMTTIEGVDRPWISVEGGSYNAGRLAAGGTIRNVAGGSLTLVGQAKRYGGPWQEAEHLRHYAGFAKYSVPVGAGTIEATLHAYHATWRPTEQIPERIIGSAVCPDVFCSPDPSARGRTTRLIGNLAVRQPGWNANLYVQYYDWAMSSNPTYAQADGTSAQIDQFDRRWIIGLTARRHWDVGSRLRLTVGTENRYDHIGNVGVNRTADRVFLRSLGHYHVEEASGALYGEATWQPVSGLRLTGGLRGDYYHYTVRARDGAALLGTGSGHDSIVSPKVSVAYKVLPQFEVYANWGRGFHSNDVRGAVNVDPRCRCWSGAPARNWAGACNWAPCPSRPRTGGSTWAANCGSWAIPTRSNRPARAGGAATNWSGSGGPCRGWRSMAAMSPAIRAMTMATASPMRSKTRPLRARRSCSIHGRRACACAIWAPIR
jgi:hypothetical protein